MGATPPCTFLTTCRSMRLRSSLLSSEEVGSPERYVQFRFELNHQLVSTNRVERAPDVGGYRSPFAASGATRFGRRPLRSAQRSGPRIVDPGGFSRSLWMLFPLAGSKTPYRPPPKLSTRTVWRTLSQSGRHKSPSDKASRSASTRLTVPYRGE